jgi:protein TonB
METSVPASSVRARRPYRARRAKPPQAWRSLPPLPKVAAPKPTSPAQSVLGLLGSAAVHATLVLVILAAAIAPKHIEAQTPVEIDVVETPKPPPPPPPPKKEEPKKEPPKLAKVIPIPIPKDAPPPPPKVEQAPPPPNEPPPPDAKPNAPVMIGISMTSTTTGGAFAAPVGNTLYGVAPRVAPKPEEVKPYAPPPGKRYVPPYKVTRLPEVLSEFKATYPEEARKLGIEGQVVLRITVDADGKVVKAAVIKGTGHGLDEAALEAIKHFRFKPGLEGEETVATEITYTYTFLLD